MSIYPIKLGLIADPPALVLIYKVKSSPSSHDANEPIIKRRKRRIPLRNFTDTTNIDKYLAKYLCPRHKEFLKDVSNVVLQKLLRVVQLVQQGEDVEDAIKNVDKEFAHEENKNGPEKENEPSAGVSQEPNSESRSKIYMMRDSKENDDDSSGNDNDKGDDVLGDKSVSFSISLRDKVKSDNSGELKSRPRLQSSNTIIDMTIVEKDEVASFSNEKDDEDDQNDDDIDEVQEVQINSNILSFFDLTLDDPKKNYEETNPGIKRNESTFNKFLPKRQLLSHNLRSTSSSTTNEPKKAVKSKSSIFNALNENSNKEEKAKGEGNETKNQYVSPFPEIPGASSNKPVRDDQSSSFWSAFSSSTTAAIAGDNHLVQLPSSSAKSNIGANNLKSQSEDSLSSKSGTGGGDSLKSEKPDKSLLKSNNQFPWEKSPESEPEETKEPEENSNSASKPSLEVVGNKNQIQEFPADNDFDEDLNESPKIETYTAKDLMDDEDDFW